MKDRIQLIDYEHENARRYTEIAYYYRRDWRGELNPDLVDKYNAFLRRLGTGNKRILDVGCGTGKAALFFAQLGHQVCCLDLSTGMLHEAMSQKENVYDLNGTLANMKGLPFAHNSFDGIWSMAAVVHLPRQGRRTVFGEFYRVLKPDGVLGLSVQNRLSPKHMKRIVQACLFDIGYDDNNQFYQKLKKPKDIFNWFSIMQALIDGYAFMDGRHWHFPTVSELRSSLNEVGFFIDSITPPLGKRIDILAIKNEKSME